MKFVLNENLFRFGNGYIGALKVSAKSFKDGDIFGQSVAELRGTTPKLHDPSVVFNRFPKVNEEWYNSHPDAYYFKPVFCTYNFYYDLPKVSLPDTEIEYILQEYYEKLRQYDTRKGGQQVGIPRTSRCRDYQVEGFKDGYNKAKEHFKIIDRRGIKEIELEDDVEECSGDCEEPDIWYSCDDGCINSRIVPRVVDGKVIVKNIVYETKR